MALEVYFAADVEADGPVPGPSSMLSLGLSVVGQPERTFYVEIKPIGDVVDPNAMAVNGLDRDRIAEEAPTPERAMAAAADFITEACAQIGEAAGQAARPVFLAGPAVWDGMWIHWYFIRFLKRNPFGVTGSGIDFRSYWMGIERTTWNKTGKKAVAKKLGNVDLPHTHRADDDAKELAAYFEKVLAHAADSRGEVAAKDRRIAELEAQLEAAGRRFTKSEKQWKKRADRPATEVWVLARRGHEVWVQGEPARVPRGRVKTGETAEAAARRIFEAATGASPSGLALGAVHEVLTEARHAWVRVVEVDAPSQGRFLPAEDVELPG